MVSSRVVDWWLHNTQTLGVFGCEICPDCHSRLDQARPGSASLSYPARLRGRVGAGDGPEVKPAGDARAWINFTETRSNRIVAQPGRAGKTGPPTLSVPPTPSASERQPWGPLVPPSGSCDSA